MNEWNTHRIRINAGSRGYGGRPVTLYNLPELYGTLDFKYLVETEELDICLEMSSSVDTLPCDKDVYELATMYTEEHNLSSPADAYEAASLFCVLRNMIKADL